MTDYYFGVDASDGEIAELMAWDTQVAEEDVSLVQSVQRGLESGAVPQGRLMGDERAADRGLPAARVRGTDREGEAPRP